LANDTPNAAACFGSSSILAAWKQRLRRNAAAKRAATCIRIGLDERDLHAKVRGMKRGDVASGARA
jgi:hypothetical protein